jgi:hypothetical protein
MNATLRRGQSLYDKKAYAGGHVNVVTKHGRSTSGLRRNILRSTPHFLICGNAGWGSISSAAQRPDPPHHVGREGKEKAKQRAKRQTAASIRSVKSASRAFLIIVLLVCSACHDLQDGLSATMTDEEILRVLKLDPTKLRSEKVQGSDGHMMNYSDERHKVSITRSFASGVIVTREKPDTKHWKLGKP